MIGHETIHYSGFVEEYSLTIIIYGSEDGVLNMGKMEEANRYLPDNSEKYIIEDGNHARFGKLRNTRGGWKRRHLFRGAAI